MLNNYIRLKTKYTLYIIEILNIILNIICITYINCYNIIPR